MIFNNTSLVTLVILELLFIFITLPTLMHNINKQFVVDHVGPENIIMGYPNLM